MYMSLGEDYDERVLPSITTEVLKAVVVSGNVKNLLLVLHLNSQFILCKYGAHSADTSYRLFLKQVLDDM